MDSLNEKQKKMIISKYDEVRNLTEVRRYFGTKYYPKHPRKVPQLVVFKLVINRFCKTGFCRMERPAKNQGWRGERSRRSQFFKTK